MASDIEYALMAGRVYQSTRQLINWLPDLLSFGWIEKLHEVRNDSGFEAVSFQKGNEIVISYAGTDPGALNDWLTNGGLATSLGAAQLRQAAAYYLQIKASAPAGTSISFTGHSLGGGLASLMAVFFNEKAVTFDQAPFAASAIVRIRDDLINYILSLKGADQQPLYTSQQLSELAPALMSFAGLAGREGNVSGFFVEGEALSLPPPSPLAALSKIGVLSKLAHGAPDLALAIELHSQTLLAAFIQNKSFEDVTIKLQDLIRLIFDKKLFLFGTDTSDENFIERLVRHQNGVAGLTQGEEKILADAMLDRFTRDLWKLAQEGGMTMKDGNQGNPDLHQVSNALIAFAIQKYYEEKTTSAGYNKELFTRIVDGNCIQFDMADVSEKFQKAFTDHSRLKLDEAKGFNLYFKQYLKTEAFNDQERALINSLLPWLRDWYVQAGASGMVATDTLNRGAFMLGGKENDVLTGGTSADLLIGNAGNDRLKGGKGNDILLGGTGNDVYEYTDGDGLDTVVDYDGVGDIMIDGAVVHGGTQYGDQKVYRDTAKHLYVQVDESTLIIDGKVIVKNYSLAQTGGSLGLNMTAAVTLSNPLTSTTIQGDVKPTDIDTEKEGIQAEADQYGNPVGSTEPNEDILLGTAANDHVLGGELNDDLTGEAGDDWVEGGIGNDLLRGGGWRFPDAEGNDLLEGGGGSDILHGEAGNDRLYGNVKIDIATAIANGNSQAGSGQKGDWLAGNAGDDTLVGGADNDVLTGGAGNDLLIGGAGDDNLLGDADYSVQFIAEDTWRYSIGTTNWYHSSTDTFNWRYTDLDNIRLYEPTFGETDPADSGADVIYAGAGNDWVYAGKGNDVIFGEAGNDTINGCDGNDVVLGGTGNDTMWGLEGSDYLDGGDDADYISGGENDDILIGGKGDDTLEGGAGQDTYIVNRGDGHDVIVDTKSENNILRFGEGISSNDVTLRLGSLMLDLGNGDEVHIEGFDRNDVFNSSSIDAFEFADGTVLTTNELLQRGFDLYGTAGNDTIVGTNTVDRIHGLGGDDQLLGGDGSDALYGDGGDDILWGDAGDDTLDGGDGNDQLVGGNGLEMLSGGTGQDRLWGEAGDDLLLGNDGNDTLVGGDGNDTLVGGRDFDQLLGGAGDDTYVINPGDTSVGLELAEIVDDLEGTNHIQLNGDLSISAMNLTPFSGLGPDLLMLQTGQSSIGIRGLLSGAIGSIEVAGVSYSAAQFFGKTYAWQVNQSITTANAVLQGGKAADTLTGTGGDSTFAGGLGNDVLVGSGGHNVYRYDLGDGVDTITDTSAATDANGQPQTSTLVFGTGIHPDDLVLSADNGVLIIGFGASQPGGLRLTGFNVNNALQATRIDRFEFADGTVLTHAQLLARGFDFVGTSAGEMLSGTNLSDRLSGGGGSDTLAGGAGGDIYTFNIGDGTDVIADGDVSSGTNDTLRFGEGFVPADVLALRNGNDVTFVYGEDRVTLRNYFSGGANAVERIEFADGTQWTSDDVLAVVQASASHDWTFTGDESNNTLYGLGGDDVLDGRGGNDTLYGSSGNDTLIGGLGSDTLYGEAGSDTYIVGLSSEQDLIDETSGGDLDGIDTVQFVDGINRANASFSRSGNDLYVQGNQEGQWFSVTVKGQFAGDSSAGWIERFIFADGIVMSAQDVKAELLRSSPWRDWISGFDTADSFSGGWGTDYLSGGAGNDTLHGDQGDDSLSGEVGADILFGDVGNDSLSGGDGDDTLDGGAGWDRLDGGAGNDTYNFGLGQGNDIIVADASGIDRIQLATGLTAANVTLHRVSSPPAADQTYRGDSLVIQLNGGTDQLWIANYFDPAAPGNIETVRFADGTTWDNAAVNSRLVTQAGTANTLTGTNKANTFVVDHWNDIVTDATLNDGDKVSASVSYRLPETITDLTLSGTLNLFAVGTSSYDILRGNVGNNWFESASGYDTLVGGKGDDVYVVKGTGQSVRPEIDPTWMDGTIITELAGEGTDTLISGFWSAQLPNNVENLILGTANVMANGASYYSNRYNDFSHKLIGNTLNNTLDASIYEGTISGQSWFNYRNYTGFGSLTDFRLDGGAGADTLIGGYWNDTYVIDNAADMVVETGVGINGYDSSRDTVETPFETSLLTQFPNIENITLTGSAAINATGNAGNNILSGALNTAANRLTGGMGNDTYVVGTGDVVVELSDEGIDTVVVASSAASTVWLSDYPNVENIRLQGNAGNLNLVGNGLANEITGSLGNNQLSGGGGDDTITDQFLGDTAVYMYANSVADNDVLEGNDGDDILISRGGLDTLDGGAGNDQLQVFATSRSATIRLGLGDGHDTLYQDGGTTVAVTVELKEGIGPNDVQIQRQSGYLTFTIFDGSSLNILETNSVSLKFADGMVLAQQQIDVMLSSSDRTTASEFNDLLFGTAGADTIAGFGGADSIYANGGADFLDGGAGNDSLFGGLGADTLLGGADNDLLAGGLGADVYRFSRGIGQDTIDDSFSSGVDDSAVDIVEFDATVLSTEVTVYRHVSGTTATGLVLTVPATGDSVAIQNVYATGGAGTIELVRFANGTQWDLPTLKSKIVGEVGYDTNDTLTAPVTASRLDGRAGKDNLTGSTGADTLDGGTDDDIMTGLAGDDIYLVDSLLDLVIEAARGGTDTVITSVNNYILPTEVERLQMTVGTQALHATGNALNNTLTGNAGNNWLDGGAGADTMIGGLGDDTYFRDSTGDVITENANEGIDLVNSSLTYTLAANLDALTLTGTNAINGTGNASDNLLIGNSAANILNGGSGTDILQGAAGNDTLTDTVGSGLFSGGTGADTMTGGASADVFFGGLDNDTYITAGGNDIILFNKGDGQDTFATGGTGSDTISLGGGISYADLVFAKATNDLVLKIGATDQITFKDWYATTPSKSVANLQVIAEAMAGFAPGGSDPLKDQKIETFNFIGLAGAFDAARAANSGLTSWALTNALTSFQLAGSDTSALGGDLAYQYGKNGTLAGIGLTPALATLSDANLGVTAQTLSPLAGLQTGSVRLN